MADQKEAVETITIPKEEFARIEKIVELAVEFQKLNEIPAFAAEHMGDMSPRQIVAQINHRTLLLVNAELRPEPTKTEEYQSAIVQLAIMVIFLCGKLDIDLVTAINNRMMIEKEGIRQKKIFEEMIEKQRLEQQGGQPAQDGADQIHVVG